MTVKASLILAAALATLAASPTLAQGQRGASITLFEGPNFTGASRSFFEDVGNLNSTGFNDRAMSAQVRGDWRLCVEANMKGRCATIDRDVANLDAVGIGRAVSSFQYEGGGRPGGGFGPGGPGPGGGPGFGPGGPGPGPGQGRPPGGFPGGGFDPGQRLEGRSAVFFPNPRAPGGGQRAADAFCRRMGLGQSLYSDNRGQDLRDVLCSR